MLRQTMRIGWRAIGLAFACGCLPTKDVGLGSNGGSESTSECADPSCLCPEWYPDEDGDGFGDVERGQHFCDEPPPDWVTNAEDCYDGNADARPGQLGAFAIDRGDGSYDYDCDEIEALDVARKGKCRPWPGCDISGTDGRGWIGPFPACGEKAPFLNDCDSNAFVDHCEHEVNRLAVAECR